MHKMAGLIGMFIGSSFGGWIGMQIGLMTMAILSAIGAGVGFYYGRKLLNDFLD